MKIDLETARHCGLGDLVTLAWCAEGARGGPDPLVFHRRRDLDVANLLSLSIDPDPGGRSLDAVYELELSDGGRRPRVDYLRELLELSTPLVRPPLNLAPEDEAWAARTAGELKAPIVLLFPKAAWRPREWPPSYWVDLAWKLEARGVAVLVLFPGDDERFKNTPRYQWNTPIPRIAALMRHAAMVVGNDSLPAHLAGTVGVRTLALMGPTRSTVFAHLPEVECMTSQLDCTGCHFQSPFRAACDQGCLSLYRLFPDQVVERVVTAVQRTGVDMTGFMGSVRS